MIFLWVLLATLVTVLIWSTANHTFVVYDNALLDSNIGYAVVLALGFLYALIMTCTTLLEQRYEGYCESAEMFTTANRSLKTGVTSAATVSAWTWAATVLTSTGVSYKFGIAGAFWYASGACIQVKRSTLFTYISLRL